MVAGQPAILVAQPCSKSCWRLHGSATTRVGYRSGGKGSGCQTRGVMAVLVTVLAVVVALLALVVAGLLRSQAEILRSLKGLGIDPGRDAPDGSSRPAGPAVRRAAPRLEPRPALAIVGVTPSGDAASIAVVGTGRSTLVAFLTSTCTMCAEFWSAFSDAARYPVPGDARVVVVTKGDEAESSTRLRTVAPADVPVVMSSTAWDAYAAGFAPYFAYVDGPSGQIVGEGMAATWDDLVKMLERALADAGISAS